MGLLISPVETEDVDLLVRKVEFPAHQDGPLHRFMFLSPGDQKESEMRWMVDGLLEAVYRENETLFKACEEEGLPIGLIGWTLGSGALSERIDGGNRIQNSPTSESKSEQGTQVEPRGSLTPPSLDVTSWLGISKRLREERQRVLQGPQENEICRITSMAVDPSYQRNGIGSALLKMFCHYIDENALDAFVMSSPAGVRLYSNFGFKAVGVVETKHGNFTSMLRTSGFMGNNGNVCEEGKLMANSHHCYEE